MIQAQNIVVTGPQQAFSFDCFYRSDIFVGLGLRPYVIQLWVITLVPIIVTFIAAIFTWIQYIWDDAALFQSSKKLQEQFKSDVFAMFIIIVFIFNPKIIQNSLAAFKCTNLGDISYPQLYLEADPDIKCWESYHVKKVISIALPSFLVWGILSPLYVLRELKRNKDNLHELIWRTRYGFLLKGYRADSYYWELIVLYKKIGMIILIVFCSNVSTIIQVFYFYLSLANFNRV